MATERIRTSLGKSYFNEGTVRELKEEKFVLDKSRRFYLLDVIPMGAVRMTVSDKWKTNPNHADPRKRQRKAVQDYFAFKNKLQWECNILKFELGSQIEIVFFIPMPDSWSEKKKEKMNGTPHKQRPDCDNVIKAVQDTLLKEDGNVWSVNAKKYWAYNGSILVYC